MYLEDVEIYLDESDFGFDLSEASTLKIEVGYLCGDIRQDLYENYVVRLDHVYAVFQTGSGESGVYQGRLDVLPLLSKELVHQFKEKLKKHFFENQSYYQEQQSISNAESNADEIRAFG